MAEANKKEDLAKKVIALKAAVGQSSELRAQAEANLSMARKQLGKVDEQLKALGVEPDDAERQLELMETALDKKVTEMQGIVNGEIATYNKVVEASRQVFA